MILFEHPLSERVRNFLRIEHLFRRFQAEIVRQDSVWSHHLALFTLFEIMECAARAELKLDILQELERQNNLPCVHVIKKRNYIFKISSNKWQQAYKAYNKNLGNTYAKMNGSWRLNNVCWWQGEPVHLIYHRIIVGNNYLMKNV